MWKGLVWFAVAAAGLWQGRAEDGVVLLQTAAKVIERVEKPSLKPSHMQAIQTVTRKAGKKHRTRHRHRTKLISVKRNHRTQKSHSGHHHKKSHSDHHHKKSLSHKHHKKSHSKDKVTESIGTQAELSKEGYEQVVAARDNDQMAIFLSRVAENDLNFTLSKSKADKPAIAGLVPYYSGVKAARGYGQLQAELKRLAKVDGSWVIPRGVAASMDEVGFKKVALLEDVQEMSDFIERLAHEKADSVVDDRAALKKFAQSDLKKGRYDVMRQKLIDVTKTKTSWLKREHPWINLMELS
jgi:ElaB/YqjD/DUF883 family membrane-anchored ribosome-binding protein